MKSIVKRSAVAYAVLLALLLGLLGALLFARLGDVPLADYDECRHGVNAYEMLRSGDFLVHTYQGETDLWNLKPPLSFWSIAASFALFGYSSFALRLYSALAALLASAAIAAWLWKRRGGLAACMAALLIAANASLFGNHFARFGDADAQYQLFFTLAMLCMLSSEKRFSWLYGSALCFGLAFLDKGAHALCIPAVCLLDLLLTGRVKELRPKRCLLLLASGLVPIAPWAIARYARDGGVFFAAMIGTDVVDRMATVADPADAAMPALWYYLRAVFESPAMLGCLAVCALCAVALVVRKTALTTETRRALIGCALWLIVPIALYTLTGAKYKWYVYSAFFAMPTLTALLLSAVLIDWSKRRVMKACLLCAAVTFFAACTVGSAQNVRSAVYAHTTQSFIRESLDRDSDAETHAYIQYSAEQTTWMPADMLTALMYGDVACFDGGVDAFLADEDYAVLFLFKADEASLIESISEECPVRAESGYLVAFDR